MTLNERIEELENKIKTLESKIQDFSRNTEGTYKPPTSVVGGTISKGDVNPIDIDSGWGMKKGGPVLWNNTEQDVPYGIQPSNPSLGYNKHSHSRYSGGALIAGVIEVVDYEWGAITNKHSQGFLRPAAQPKIKKEQNSKGQVVDAIGLLNLTFNPDTLTWGCATYEIDIKSCYLVQRRTTVNVDGDGNPIPGEDIGDIEKDSKGQLMKSPLWNEDVTKTSIAWDENGICFRLYAAYAPEPEE